MADLKQYNDTLKKIGELSREFKESQSILKRGDIRIISSMKRKLYKINIDLVEEYLDSIKGLSISSFYKNQSEKYIKNYRVMSDLLNKYTPAPKGPKSAIPPREKTREKSFKEKEDQKYGEKFEGLKKAYQSLSKNIYSLSSQAALDEIKRMERRFNLINVESISPDNQKEFYAMKNDLIEQRDSFLKILKSEKYGPKLKALVKKYVIETINMGRDNDRADSISNFILDELEKADNIDFFEPYIKRILSGRIKPQEFTKLYEIIKKVAESAKEANEGEYFPYLEDLNEDFYNPFEEEDDKPKKPENVRDAGKFLGVKRESFNPNRIEYTKKGGSYVVKARTHFGAGETVEISPVIILGSESTAIDGLKDIVYELNPKSGEYALVLGYGSLYTHSDKPNLSYAYSKKTKQMHFITTRIVHLGEDLTINYGKDYWVARKEFNMTGDYDKGEASVTRLEPQLIKGDVDESEIQPNAADMQSSVDAKSYGNPRSRTNPAVTGIAIKGIGQQ